MYDKGACGEEYEEVESSVFFQNLGRGVGKEYMFRQLAVLAKINPACPREYTSILISISTVGASSKRPNPVSCQIHSFVYLLSLLEWEMVCYRRGQPRPCPEQVSLSRSRVHALGAVNESPKPYSQLNSQNIVCYLDQETSGSQVEYLAFVEEANAKANWEPSNETS
jgi:hypothetical protein